MSILQLLIESDEESVTMTEDDFLDLIEDAVDVITGESEEDDPIVSFEVSRRGNQSFEFSYSYTGWGFESVDIEIKE